MSRGHLLLVSAVLLAGLVWAGQMTAQAVAAWPGAADQAALTAATRKEGCGLAWRAARERFLRAPAS